MQKYWNQQLCSVTSNNRFWSKKGGGGFSRRNWANISGIWAVLRVCKLEREFVLLEIDEAGSLNESLLDRLPSKLSWMTKFDLVVGREAAWNSFRNISRNPKMEILMEKIL